MRSSWIDIREPNLTSVWHGNMEPKLYFECVCGEGGGEGDVMPWWRRVLPLWMLVLTFKLSSLFFRTVHPSCFLDWSLFWGSRPTPSKVTLSQYRIIKHIPADIKQGQTGSVFILSRYFKHGKAYIDDTCDKHAIPINKQLGSELHVYHTWHQCDARGRGGTRYGKRYRLWSDRCGAVALATQDG